MGVFKRLKLEPGELLSLDPQKQEDLIKKYIANDVMPEQIAFYLDKLNVINQNVLNIQNDMDLFPQLRSTDYLQGYYSYEPNNDRQVTKMQWDRIEKMQLAQAKPEEKAKVDE